MQPGNDARSFLERICFEDLQGWEDHDHTGALDAFRLSCLEILDHGSAFSRLVHFGGSRSSWSALCREAFSRVDAKHFFETRFLPYRVSDHTKPEGLFTGYYEPEVEGSRTASPAFPVPIYRPPPDLVTFSEEVRRQAGIAVGRMVGGRAEPYLTRREIEEGALSGQGLELVFLRDWADAFFIHIQGSGRVRLDDGTTMRLTYGAKSGLPYTGIGSLLVDRGVFSHREMSMQTIRAWMASQPIEARSLMWLNQSFIFFQEAKLERPELGAMGAQHVQLTPLRSLAVDRSWWMFGTPMWLDMEVPTGDDSRMTTFRQLLIAQDTGSAIRGLARGDVYWGFGEEAARIAGSMKSTGSMVAFLPRPVAEELGLAG